MQPCLTAYVHPISAWSGKREGASNPPATADVRAMLDCATAYMQQREMVISCL